MGNCRVYGKERQLRDTHGNTPQSPAILNKAMDRWRKKQELLKECDKNGT